MIKIKLFGYDVECDSPKEAAELLRQLGMPEKQEVIGITKSEQKMISAELKKNIVDNEIDLTKVEELLSLVAKNLSLKRVENDPPVRINKEMVMNEFFKLIKEKDSLSSREFSHHLVNTFGCNPSTARTWAYRLKNENEIRFS